MTPVLETLRGDLAASLDACGGFLFQRWAEKVRARGGDPDLIRKMVADLAPIARDAPTKKALTAACRLWVGMQEAGK